MYIFGQLHSALVAYRKGSTKDDVDLGNEGKRAEVT
jgi:hypothetical protein